MLNQRKVILAKLVILRSEILVEISVNSRHELPRANSDGAICPPLETESAWKNGSDVEPCVAVFVWQIFVVKRKKMCYYEIINGSTTITPQIK